MGKMKKIYVVRHCKANGQEFEATLTNEGIEQAKNLVAFFSDKSIQQVISSPMTRAIQTIHPFTQGNNLKIQKDERLSERILSSREFPDWMEKLKQTFEQTDLKFEGGESSEEASNRILSVIEEVKQSAIDRTIIVSHGNIIALLLKQIDKRIAFEDWQNLTNPDVFLIECSHEDEWSYQRVWNVDEIMR